MVDLRPGPGCGNGESRTEAKVDVTAAQQAVAEVTVSSLFPVYALIRCGLAKMGNGMVGRMLNGSLEGMLDGMFGGLQYGWVCRGPAEDCRIARVVCSVIHMRFRLLCAAAYFGAQQVKCWRRQHKLR